MNHSALPLQGLILGLCILGSILGFVPSALSQEVEPNNTCLTSQNVGTVEIPFTLEGSLDSTPETPDVDFFRFTGTPGSLVRVDLEGQATGQGTLGDPFLGLFGSDCILFATDDDGSGTLNARLVFTVPADGIFVLAATLCCDSEFLGGGVGTYRLSITPFLAISSISGRIVDALSGTPLPGDVFPFASAVLQRCVGFTCFDVSSQSADSAGRFQFSTDFNGLPLEIGFYQVRAFANGYGEGQTAPFEVEEGEDRDVGDIPLQPVAPIQFSEIRPCGDLPPEGGQCRFSVRIRNRQPTLFQGQVWFVVEGSGIGSFADFTRFQPRRPQDITIDPEGPTNSRVVQFNFQVPNTVRNGATICTQLFVGQGENPFFDTVGQGTLFCIVKGFSGGFSVVSVDEVNRLCQQGNAPSVIPSKKQGGLVPSPENVR